MDEAKKFCRESLKINCLYPHWVEANLERIFATRSIELGSWSDCWLWFRWGVELFILLKFPDDDEANWFLIYFINHYFSFLSICLIFIHTFLLVICNDLIGFKSCSITSSLHKQASHVSSVTQRSWSSS